ncbi:MAG: serine hydrolase domain-containing protein, partial [Verrucomicrobiota bacterium]
NPMRFLVWLPLFSSVFLLSDGLAEKAFLPTANPASLGFSAAGLERLRQRQQAFIDEGLCLSNVALVARKGKVIYYEAAQADAPETRPIDGRHTLFPIWSMTKPVTSVAAMILHQRDVFQLDDPVSKAIPLLDNCLVKTKEGDPVPLDRSITYRDLLTHTSGIAGYDGSFDEEGTWKEIMELESNAAVIRLLTKKPIEHQPGIRYTYGMSTAVLGRAIEVLTGQTLAGFFEKEIFGPLGMDQTRFYLTPADRKRFQPLAVKKGEGFRPGTPAEDELYYAPESTLYLGGEGLVSTIEDYGRFCQMLVNRGRAPNGRPILSESTLDLMLKDHLAGLRETPTNPDGTVQGLGFAILKDPSKSGDPSSPSGLYSWGGYHTTHFWVDPRNELYAIFMTRLYPFNKATESRFRKAVYEAFK